MASRNRPRRDEEVLSAAARVFRAQGYAGTSVQDVADELGILKGSLYHYISSKEELLFWICSHSHEQASAIMQAAVESSDNPLESLGIHCQLPGKTPASGCEMASPLYRRLHDPSSTMPGHGRTKIRSK